MSMRVQEPTSASNALFLQDLQALQKAVQQKVVMPVRVQDLTSASKALSLQDLQELQKTIQQQIEQKEKAEREGVTNTYGTWFTGIVGVDEIVRLPAVEANTLGLDVETKYHNYVVNPSSFPPNTSAVRGIEGYNRPFIAIKVELLNEKQELIAVVAEVIFKRYSLDGDGGVGRMYENNFVTGDTIDDQGAHYSSTLHGSGGMIQKDIEAVRDLLQGKTIKPPLNRVPTFIRMVKA